MKEKIRQILKNAFYFTLIFAALSFFCGVKPSFLVMVGLLVHEYGHIITLKNRGVRYRLVFNIFGAQIRFDTDDFDHLETKAYTALGGLFSGFLFSALVLILFSITYEGWMGVAALLLFIFTLFNIVPIYMLDGGRVVSAILFSVRSCLVWLFIVAGVIISAVFFILNMHSLLIASIICVLLIFSLISIRIAYLEYHAWMLLKRISCFEMFGFLVIYFWVAGLSVYSLHSLMQFVL